MIDWKQVAHHQRFRRRLAELDVINVKRRLWEQHEARVTLVNAMSELLPIIAGNGDPSGTDYCLICERDGVHANDCPYIRALDAVNAAARVHS